MQRRRAYIFRAQVLRRLNPIGVNINQVAHVLDSDTCGLLAYLYGPSRHDEHLVPHTVAGFAMLDPGREETPP